jgi:hypothetical protein
VPQEPPAVSRWTGWLEGLSHLISLLRYAFGIGLMRVFRRPSYTPGSGEDLYARAVVERVKIEERYSYRQEISLNAHSEMVEQPTGKVEIKLPYDGYKYFTRKAYADITRILGRGHSEAVALVGHLAFSGYSHTDLDSLLDLEETYGSYPIRVPIQVDGNSGKPGELIADRSTRIFSCDYRPQPDVVKVNPIYIHMDLLDPDSSGDSVRRGRDMTAGEIMQQVSFRPELLLRMTVLLHVPAEPEEDVPADVAKVAKVTVGWPTITSLRDLSLKVHGKDHPVRYNPEGRCLEWSQVEMTSAPGSPAGGLHTYTSGAMELSIPQPGELYQEQNVQGSVEVKIDRLLSGVQARLFGPVGVMQRQRQPKLVTRVTTQFDLILDDAFAKRLLTTYQHLHFDEVVPTELRISDIKVALANRGFRVTDLGPENNTQGRWLRASRFEGADQMMLYLYVEGIPHRARRDSQVPGGVSYRSDLESGEIRIYVYGQLPRKSQSVTHEINALRRALRERFDHLPARR